MSNSLVVILCLLSFIAASCAATRQTIPPTIQPTVPPTTLPTEIPEAATPTIGYSSVAEALAALKARNDVKVEVQNGWTIITEADGFTTWSFTPLGHPAYPAVAKRVLYQDQAGWHIKMDVLCEADKAACDQFVRDFEALNEQMQQAIEQNQSTQQAP